MVILFIFSNDNTISISPRKQLIKVLHLKRPLPSAIKQQPIDIFLEYSCYSLKTFYRSANLIFYRSANLKCPLPSAVQ